MSFSPKEEEKEVSASKAATICNVANNTITSHCLSGGLAHRKRFNQYKIKLGDLKKWANSNGLEFDFEKI